MQDSRFALCWAFADAARRYWLGVFPRVCRELSHWRARADQIPDPSLRSLALQAHQKRGNCEGAAVFATFVEREHRGAVTRALVAFQSAYNYLDMLAEQPHPDPIKNGHRLHEALLSALDPDTTRPDFYEHYRSREDNGYLREMIEACQSALAELPSYPSLADAARRAAQRIVTFQSLNLSNSQGEHKGLEDWASEQTPSGSGLNWWETAASGGSSMCVYALLALAANQAVQPAQVKAIEDAYFPWIGSLHSLLDSLVDSHEDASSDQRNLMDYYTSPEQAAQRMQAIAAQAAESARSLPQGRQHTIILAGMVSYYLSAPESRAPRALPISENVRETLGVLAKPTLLVFGIRNMISRLVVFMTQRRGPKSPRSAQAHPSRVLASNDERQAG